MLTVPIYEFAYADGVVAGCGTAAELDHWSAEGVMVDVSLGRIIGREPATEDARRALAWGTAA